MKIGSTRNTLVNTGHPTTNNIYSKYILKSYVGLLFHLSENWTLEQATGSGESKCSARGIHQCLFLSFLKCFPTISQLLSPSSIQLCKHTSDNNDSEILATRAGILLSQNLHSCLISSWKKDWHIIKNEYLITSLVWYNVGCSCQLVFILYTWSTCLLSHGWHSITFMVCTD